MMFYSPFNHPRQLFTEARVPENESAKAVRQPYRVAMTYLPTSLQYELKHLVGDYPKERFTDEQAAEAITARYNELSRIHKKHYLNLLDKGLFLRNKAKNINLFQHGESKSA